MKKHILILLSAAVTLLLGCTREEDRIPENQGIRFRVSAGSDAIPTKTLYSGDTYEVGAGVYKERIDWSAGDQISIYCPESSGDKVGIYSIGGAEDSTPDPDEKSHASGITSVDGKLQWGGATKYNFYARYPDPSWSTGSGTPYAHSAFSSQGANSTSFLCYLPATQTVTHDGSTTSTYLPEMKYCYMTASALNVDKLADDIALSFSPAVNTLEITIPNDYSSGTFTISELKLVSASHRLNGEYSINVATGAATVSETSLIEADRTITLYFGSPTITVPNGGELKFTVFTCPVNLNDITLYLTLDDGYVRTLPLKNETSPGSGSYTWLSFDAFKKYRVNCSTVADPYIYEIRTDAPEYTVTPSSPGTNNAGTATIKMASTKNKLGVITASPWKAQYYSTDGGIWTDMDADHHPEGVTLSQYTGAGDVDGEDITITVPAGGNTSTSGPITYTFATAPTDNSSEANAVDLSKYNFLTNTVESTYETANCYVIRAPGWYKFPLVYGNAVKGNSLTAKQESAYKNMSGTSSSYYMGVSGSEKPFVDGLGHSISDTNYSISFTGTPGVGIVWTDAPSEVIESSTIKIDGGYVFFNVLSASIYPSNTVIKVTDDGTIVWSWHIWLVPEEMNFGEKAVYNHSNEDALDFYMLTANVGQRPAVSGTVNQYAAGEYSIRFVSKVSGRAGSPVTVNREALITDVTDAIGEGLSPFFQWGRKDPMRAPNSNKTDPWGSAYKVNANTLQYAAANPDKFLKNGANYDWQTTGTYLYNRWDTGQSGELHHTYPTKSVYDPSPRGYCVTRLNDIPTLGDNGFSSSGTFGDYDHWSSTPYLGYVHFNTKHNDSSETLTFPACGLRLNDTGAFNVVGYSVIHATSASITGSPGTLSWSIRSVAIGSSSGMRSVGYVIRSIRIPTP